MSTCRIGKTFSKLALAGPVVFTLSFMAQAQNGSGPVQMISNAEFNQMVQSGQLKLSTPATLVDQAVQRLLAYLRNQAIVDQFIRQNPNLPGFAAMAQGTPQNPKAFRTLDGAFRTQIPNSQGILQTIETNGQDTKLAQLASSIQASQDPVQQLALYKSSYSKYAAFYNQVCSASSFSASVTSCANLILPSALTDPATLENASLPVIETALETLGSLAANVIAMTPPSSGGPVACSAQMGASSVADNMIFGDQTNSAGCTEPSLFGIVANVNFPSKNLLSCIKNQGSRGSCHIFAATSAMEELIARDTGKYLNLSEEDFNENEKLIWGPSYYGDSGDPAVDLNHALSNGYKFAYENQWDYNPSLFQPPPPAYEYQNTCMSYPYPSLEPSCSDSAPQALQYCTEVAISTFAGPAVFEECGFAPATPSGARSPYMSTGASNIWNPKQPGLSVNYIILSLAFNNAVLLSFGASNDFGYASPGGFVPYDPADIADHKAYLGGHDAHVVGYLANSDLASDGVIATPGAGGGYFILKNSWGACFGDAGYYYMPVAYLEATASAVYVVTGESH